MIKLIFFIQKETFIVEIKEKEIWYLDRKLKRATRLVPVDNELNKNIILSRNKLPNYLLDMFKLTKEEQEEYENAKDENEIATICIRDCEKNLATLQKREEYSEKEVEDGKNL